LRFRGQPIAVKISEDDSKIETTSPLRFQPGDSLIVRELTSREFINRYRGFYLLVINAVKGKTRIKVAIEDNANLNGSIECYALSEDLNKIKITHNTDFAPIPESNSGITYLVEWQKL
jgi:hypothetical protein